MRKCSKCLEIKKISQFHFRSKLKNILNSWCKECMASYDKIRFKSNLIVREKKITNKKINTELIQQFIFDFLIKNPYIDCGEINPIVLEFDHKVSNTKLDALAEITRHGSLEKVKNEIEKCEVRCANCHRIRTAKNGNWYRYRLYNNRE